MLSAKEARKIAGSELLQIMNIIRDSADAGGLSIKLDYYIGKDTTNQVEETEIPIYYESPYGKIDDEPSGYKKQTIISWK